MKTTFTAALLLFFVWAAQAQTGLVSGNLNITVIPSNVGSGRFQVSGSFSDPKGQWFASNVDTGMVMWKGNNLYPIESILSQSGANITFRVVDLYNTGFISTGTAQVLELTPNLQLPAVSSSGDSNAALATPPDHAALVNYIISKLDSVIPVNTLYIADGQTEEDRQVDVSDGVLEFSQKLRLQSFYETQTIIEPLSPNTSNSFKVNDIQGSYVALGATNADYIVSNGGGAYVGKIESDTIRIVQEIRDLGGSSITSSSGFGNNMMFNDYGQLLVSGRRTNGLRGKIYIYNKGIGVDTFYLHQTISSDSIWGSGDQRFGSSFDIDRDKLVAIREREPDPQGWGVWFVRDSLTGMYWIDTFFYSQIYRPTWVRLAYPFAAFSYGNSNPYIHNWDGSSWTYLFTTTSGWHDLSDSLIAIGVTSLNRIELRSLPSKSLIRYVDAPNGFTNFGSYLRIRGDTIELLPCK